MIVAPPPSDWCEGPLNLTVTARKWLLSLTDAMLPQTAATVANLPVNPAQGAIRTVTDALGPVAGSVVVGGGTVPVLAWWTGTAWHVVSL